MMGARANPLIVRLAWFGLLWAASVASLAGVAFVLRRILS